MDNEIENLKLQLELCYREFELYKVKYKLYDYKKGGDLGLKFN